MRNQYEQESSPQLHRVLNENLLETTINEEETSTTTAANNDTNF